MFFKNYFFLKNGILIFYIGCIFYVFYENCICEMWIVDCDWIVILFCCYVDG